MNQIEATTVWDSHPYTISISDLCLESYPCQHYIKVSDQNETIYSGLYNGRAILDIITQYGGNNVPPQIKQHFEGYRN